MSITQEKKQEIIKKHAQNEKDTGSPEVQVSVLTERIKNMTEHMKVHKKDLHSQRGLIAMVNRRRRLLKYIKNNSVEQYQALIKELGLRH
ncbi:MAG: 30S ribosomal protein S15 [Alphaproteobacteria bacterium]|jgi:small subunit ribosomal protein S15|nr:MAG: 30S ribosomal protein S15 [Alphaproteobacteria bacterium]